MQQHAGDDCAGVQKAGEFDTFLFVRVDFEKDNEPHTRIGAQAGNDRGKGERAAKVELCQQHGGCAVGNKSQESCQERLQDASI